MGSEMCIRDSLTHYKLVPNQNALYRLIQRDEKGLPIRDNDWGLKADADAEDATKARTRNMIAWDSDQNDKNVGRTKPRTYVRYQDGQRQIFRLPPMRISLPKKRRLIDDEVLDHNSFARSDLLDEKGWKGRIELHVRPITFRREISYTQGYPPTNICKYIGASDLLSLIHISEPTRPY